MSKIEIAKKALGLAADFGSGFIVSNIVKNNVVTKTPLETVAVVVASFGLGSAAGEVAENEICRQVDAVVDIFKNEDDPKLHIVKS